MSSIFVVAFDRPQADPVRTSLLYYWKTAQDTSSSAVETNIHFIGRFTQPQFSRFNYNTQAADFSSSAVETNTNFIGKFTQPQFNNLALLRQQQDWVSSTTAPQPEAPPHFIGRFTAPRHIVVAPFSSASDVTLSPETNTHFIGKFTPVLHVLLPLLRSNIAADFSSSTTETNVHFLGRFTQPIFKLLPSLRQTTAQDLSGPPPVTPVVGVPATYYLLEDLWINNTYLQAGTTQTTADLGGNLPINWVPNPNVDPVDANAVAAYRFAGYQPRGLIRTQFTPLPVRAPAYNWKLINGVYTLVRGPP